MLKIDRQKIDVLRQKTRGKRYTILQKQAILNDYYMGKNVKTISRIYNASLSSVYRFVRDSWSNRNSMIL